MLVRQLLEVCVLRRGPQDLPYSPPAAAAAFVALLVLQGAAGAWNGAPPGAIAGRLLVTVLLLPGVTAPLLRARGLDNRLAQTLLAQAGTGLLFSLAMLPVALALLPYVASTQTPAGPPPQALLPAFLGLALFLWKLRVDASIWAQALDLRRPRALLLAVVLVIAELLLVPLFAGSVPAPAAS